MHAAPQGGLSAAFGAGVQAVVVDDRSPVDGERASVVGIGVKRIDAVGRNVDIAVADQSDVARHAVGNNDAVGDEIRLQGRFVDIRAVVAVVIVPAHQQSVLQVPGIGARFGVARGAERGPANLCRDAASVVAAQRERAAVGDAERRGVALRRGVGNRSVERVVQFGRFGR